MQHYLLTSKLITFFAFKFIRISSFMFSVTGVYRDIQLFLSGVNLCWGTVTCKGILPLSVAGTARLCRAAISQLLHTRLNSIFLPFCSYALRGANWGLLGPAGSAPSDASVFESIGTGPTSCNGVLTSFLDTLGILAVYDSGKCYTSLAMST